MQTNIQITEFKDISKIRKVFANDLGIIDMTKLNFEQNETFKKFKLIIKEYVDGIYCDTKKVCVINAARLSVNIVQKMVNNQNTKIHIDNTFGQYDRFFLNKFLDKNSNTMSYLEKICFHRELTFRARKYEFFGQTSYSYYSLRLMEHLNSLVKSIRLYGEKKNGFFLENIYTNKVNLTNMDVQIQAQALTKLKEFILQEIFTLQDDHDVLYLRVMITNAAKLAVKTIQENLNHGGIPYFKDENYYGPVNWCFFNLLIKNYKYDLQIICTDAAGPIPKLLRGKLFFNKTQYSATAQEFRKFLFNNEYTQV